MQIGDIFISLILAAVMVYAARNLVVALRAGRIGIPGGRTHDRARRPRQFWAGVAFEAVMVLVFGAMLVRQLT